MWKKGGGVPKSNHHDDVAVLAKLEHDKVFHTDIKIVTKRFRKKEISRDLV